MTIQEMFQSSLALAGEFTLFIGDTIVAMRRLWYRRNIFLHHCENIGVSSSGIIVVAATFLGGVLGYQLYVSFHLFNAEALLGGSVGVAMFRELAPVMTAIMVTGRAGAAMAAEIASMKVSEQVDALEVMAVDPIEFLITPRIAAGFVMLPILSLFFTAVASIAAAGVACGIMGLTPAIYWEQYSRVVDRIDLVHCIVKGSAFGLILTWVGCFNGYRAFGGARAVGLATRNTVVASCLLVLLVDYILTSFLPFGFGKLIRSLY
ncbi:MAG: ABC transporter permease [Proteobacteria bacterium]|nr:MAG: ABC transporter permease [Pseudomonadota bacterium]